MPAANLRYSTTERSTDAQRPEGVLRGGRLEIGVKTSSKRAAGEISRSAPPLSRLLLGTFLAEYKKSAPPEATI